MRVVLLLLIAVLFIGAATATGATLITSSDVRNGTLIEKDLNAKVRTKLNRPMKPGPAGSPGLIGESGLDGIDGTDGSDGIDGIDGSDGADGRDGIDAPDINDPDPVNDPDPNDPEIQEAESQDPEIQNPEIQDPDNSTDCAGLTPINPPRTCPGAKGDTGPQGPPGTFTPLQEVAVVGNIASPGGEVTATCPANTIIVSAGFRFNNANNSNMTLTGLRFNPVTRVATVFVRLNVGDEQLTAIAYCAS